MIILPLTRGQVTFIDNEDEALISQYKWYAHWDGKNYYAVTCSGKVRMHRLISDAKFGVQVDHIDGNGLNNQKYNLRPCNNTQNSHNKKKSRSMNGQKPSSIYKGVYWDKFAHKWAANIFLSNKKHKLLGRFKTEIEAALEYDLAALQYFGRFARLNIMHNPA